MVKHDDHTMNHEEPCMPRNIAAMPSSWHDHDMAAMFFQPGLTDQGCIKSYLQLYSAVKNTLVNWTLWRLTLLKTFIIKHWVLFSNLSWRALFIRRNSSNAVENGVRTKEPILNQTKLPILETGQCRRFRKWDKTADSEKETKPPIPKMRQNRRFRKWDETADFVKENKLLWKLFHW